METFVNCKACGARFNRGRDSQHLASRWHKVAKLARDYHDAGLSYAEIARQLRLSRYYVSLKLHQEGL
jgi:DNA-binding transcriptional regulator LsrR (DeoR family)